MKANIIISAIIPTTMLLLAAFIRFPYDYYIILRWVVLISGGYIAYSFYKKNNQPWLWTMVVVVLIF